MLVRLVLQGFVTREQLVAGKYSQQVEIYDRKHLLRPERVAWLAADIISGIIEGEQPTRITSNLQYYGR